MKTPMIRAAFLLAALTACSRDEARAPEHASGATSTDVGLATVSAKPEMLPPDKRRVIELEGGVRVEVLAEGQGSIVAPGDEVALSMTLSYVPLPPKLEVEAPKEEPVDDAKPAKSKSKSKDAAEEKPADASTESEKKDAATDAKPVEIAGDATATATSTPTDAQVDEVAKSEVVAPATEKPAVDSTTAKDDTVVDTSAAKPSSAEANSADASSAEANSADASSADATNAEPSSAAPESASPTGAQSSTDTAPPSTEANAPIDEVGTAPAPAPLAAPLDPVIVLSTKSSGTPIRARVGAEGGLIPGLSRALVGLRAGTIAEITLPPEAAYGADGLPAAGIPAGTSLTARIEIREVRR